MDPVSAMVFACVIAGLIQKRWQESKADFADQVDRHVADLAARHPGWSPNRLRRVARRHARGRFLRDLWDGFPEIKAEYAAEKEAWRLARQESLASAEQRIRDLRANIGRVREERRRMRDQDRAEREEARTRREQDRAEREQQRQADEERRDAEPEARCGRCRAWTAAAALAWEVMRSGTQERMCAKCRAEVKAEREAANTPPDNSGTHADPGEDDIQDAEIVRPEIPAPGPTEPPTAKQQAPTPTTPTAPAPPRPASPPQTPPQPPEPPHQPQRPAPQPTTADPEFVPAPVVTPAPAQSATPPAAPPVPRHDPLPAPSGPTSQGGPAGEQHTPGRPAAQRATLPASNEGDDMAPRNPGQILPRNTISAVQAATRGRSSGESFTHGQWDRATRSIRDETAALPPDLEQMLRDLRSVAAGRGQVNGVTKLYKDTFELIRMLDAMLTEVNQRERVVIAAVGLAGGPDDIANIPYYRRV